MLLRPVFAWIWKIWNGGLAIHGGIIAGIIFVFFYTRKHDIDLLDILDVSQNKRFVDNYIDEEVDLSKILFVLTANDISSIPTALLDRLEIIDLTGYSNEEKTVIYFIVDRFQISKMRDIVHTIDEHAFITITEVADVFRSNMNN